MTRPAFGFTLQPELEYLRLTRHIVEDLAEFYEISPEAMWGRDYRRIDAHSVITEIVQRSGRPCVGHGLGYSVGAPKQTARHRAWLEQLAAERARFSFAWYSEHLGFTEHDSWQATLPLPLPPTPEAVQVVAARLRELKAIAPDVAFENNVAYFAACGPLAEAAFFRAICDAADCWILLDLHNAFTQCRNFGWDLHRYLDAMDLSRVIEIHVSGGSESEASWLRSGRIYRLDTHDGPVPEPVWQALEDVLPRCTNLRGVVLERLPQGLDAENLPSLERECLRLREILGC